MFRNFLILLIIGIAVATFTIHYQSDFYEFLPRPIIVLFWFVAGVVALVRTYQNMEYGIFHTIIANHKSPLKLVLRNISMSLASILTMGLLMLLINVLYKGMPFFPQAYGFLGFAIITVHTMLIGFAVASWLWRLPQVILIFIFTVWFTVETVITNQACGMETIPLWLFALPFAGIRIIFILKLFHWQELALPLLWTLLLGFHFCYFTCPKRLLCEKQ